MSTKKVGKKKMTKGKKIEASENVIMEEECGNQVPAKTCKKRDKSLKKPDHVHESKGQNKALRYLKLWNANRKGDDSEPWKFEKCRQIWLLQNCYNSAKIPKDDFKVLVKYIGTIQGRMRCGTLASAKAKIDLAHKWKTLTDEGKSMTDIQTELGSEEPDEIVRKRARKIVKILSVDDEAKDSE